ncbi:FtsK/SpoIIIE family DNA translocase [Rhodopila sp.]|jgi:S-DNA-T family DNA segregation ATPase FtsK/SpoIIIE|uniref:FtsK/SpoIIIE family DNA translocase n=1 Tax=Rhodopila sp. TaxID=2480087 RepID=UPI002B5620A6|nr:DNA translocase FtsK 4TM domain-containing protein [Rhodopila sp.]HVZ08410.1 DNA translocase FtsK 4TM domain-containing protein [Rhodopila sp.]
MALRAPVADSRRLASPALRALMSRRSAELGGLLLGLLGLAILVALVFYDPRDPSLNTATTRRVSNLAGPGGAVIADILLQGFGLAGALPGMTLLAWAWRIVSDGRLSNFALRLAMLLAAMPILAAVLGAFPAPKAHWPVVSGLGGSVGELIAHHGLALGASLFGMIGSVMIWLIGTALALVLALLALGLSASEWRTAGRAAAVAGRYSVYGGRSAAGVVARRASTVGAASGWLVNLVNRNPGLADGEAGDQPPAGRPESRLIRARDRRPDQDAADNDSQGAPQLAAPRPPPVAEVPPPVTRAVRQPPIPARKPQQQALPLETTGWRFPPMSLLKESPAKAADGPSEEALQANARLLETVLSDYGVQGEIVEIRPGPVVTLYELVPAPGIRSARVIGLADDVARSLSVTAVRIATVPGRNVIGIEVPNARRETVYLSEILGSEEVQHHGGRLSLALGKDIGGKSIVADLSRMPHLMIAGTTGSGKSVGVNAMILSLLYRLSPDQCRLILIDPKMLELSTYEGIPHLMAPVVTEPAKAVTALKWTVREMERRYRAMSQLGVRNVGGYNDRVEEARRKGEVVTRKVQTGFDPDTGRPTFEEQPLALEPLPFIVVVVDEMADLMMVAGKEIEAAVQRLAQMARAAGIHVIMATQRPSVDVITGTIKANFPTRISFQVISKFDSRTILGEQGAEQLLGMGDMLFMQGGGRITRVHGPFVSDDEVEKVVAFLREQGEPSYVEDVTEPLDKDGGDTESLLSGIGGGGSDDKTLFDQAVAVIAREGKASTSFIQRHLNIGYNKAAKLIEQMEKEGIIGPANHVGKREILVRRTNDDMDC